MQDNNRVFTLIPGVIIFSVMLLISTAVLSLPVIYAESYDLWFWLLLSTFIIIDLFWIWCIISMCQYIDINFSEIKYVSYKGIYCVKFSDIELVEIRKTAIGHLNIIVKTKEPIRLVKRNKKRNKFMQEFGFIHSAKLVGIFKYYLPKEIPWVYNDYYKNPNLEPKKPKKK